MKLHLLLAASLSAAAVVSAAELPQLRPQGTAIQLVVDSQPFLIRGGEVGNSTGEPDYLRQFWPKLRAMQLNTLLVPVYWDVIEPEEGKFDFSTVDRLVADAREHKMRLVLLWFGSWKNSMSCYAPAWVKRDYERFPRSQDSAGRALEILSPFYAQNWETDARSFAAVMRHIREIDAKEQAVLMVQVENEIGMIPEARDRNPEAEKQFAAAVPAALIEYLVKNDATLAPEIRRAWLDAGGRRSGTWTEVFGPGVATDEIFMAWHFARYTEVVTAAGKKEYALPMFVNAALIRSGHSPGQYPSAGPLPHLMDVWRATAPSIDFLSPDIYFPNFAEWAKRYVRAGNAVFIPESVGGVDGAVKALYAFAGVDAIGVSPFAIETADDVSVKAFAASYGLVAQLTPLIGQHQGLGTMVGLLPAGAEQRQPQQVWLGGYVIHVAFERAAGRQLMDELGNPLGASAGATSVPAGGLVIAIGPDEFLFAGMGITATFSDRANGQMQVGILSAEEGRFVDGEWTHTRWLNGDQTHQGRHIRIEPGRWGLQRVKLYRYR